MPVATLEFASICLRNALLLTPEESVGGSPAMETDDSSDAGCAFKTILLKKLWFYIHTLV